MAKFVKTPKPEPVAGELLQFPSDVLVTLEEQGYSVDVGGYYGKALDVTRRGEFKGSFVFIPEVSAEDLDSA